MHTRLRLIRPNGRSERLVAVFLLGLALFMPPLLTVAIAHDTLVGGVPLPVLWLFGGWLALIVLLALVVRARPEQEP